MKKENIRDMDQISYRLLSFIYFSHLFIARILGYITDQNLTVFTIKDMTLFEILEADWDIFQDLTKNNIRVSLNSLYGHIHQLLSSVDYFPTYNSFQTFEKFFNQKKGRNASLS